MENNNLSPADIAYINSLSKDPVLWAESFLLNPKNGKPLKINYPQRLIMRSESRATWIAVHRRAGKCVCGSAQVLNRETLKPQPISDPNITETLVFDFKTSQVQWAPCKWIKSGQKECLSLKLGTGIELPVSTDHRVFDSKQGWIQASRLRVGDRILAPSRIPVFGEVEVSEADLKTLTVQTQLGNAVPDQVYKFTETSLKAYIKSLWNEVGLCSRNQECCTLMFYSKQLCLEVHHLLLRFEIESALDGNTLQITDLIDRSNFLNLVGIPAPVYEVRSPRRWEIVTFIQKIGLQDVFDLSVEHPDHNFIASNCVVHNSYSQVILALYYAICYPHKQIVVFAPGNVQITAWFEVLDTYLKSNPIAIAMQDPKGKNSNQPTPHRSFINGSSISGFVMGMNAGHEGGKRGLGADIIFVDEAQSLKELDWRVLTPILEGDDYREGGTKSYITGTILEPSGKFYNKIFKETNNKDQNIIKIPITENRDIKPEKVEEKRLRICTDAEGFATWSTEYMLEIGNTETTVFQKEFVDRAFSIPYEYGPQLMNMQRHRFIGVDWDKVGAGTNMAVIEYDDSTRQIRTIYREEVPKSAFTYTESVNRLFILWDLYQPDLIIVDAGGGEMQWEQLVLGSMQRRSNLADRLIRLPFNTKIDTVDLQTGEPKKVMVKPYLVSMLKKKFEEGNVRMPEGDTLLKEQLLSYKKLRETQNTVVFSSNNEHVIDCHLFALYGIWLYFESNLSIPDTGMKIIRNEELSQSYIDTEQHRPPDFWADEDKNPSPSIFYGESMMDTVSRSSFGSFSRSLFGGTQW